MSNHNVLSKGDKLRAIGLSEDYYKELQQQWIMPAYYMEVLTLIT